VEVPAVPTGSSGADVNETVRTKIDKLGEEERATWTAAAQRLVRQYIRIIVYPQTEKQLVTEIQNSDLGRMVGDLTGTVLIHYDVKMAGESVTAPRLRTAPFQEKVYEKYVQAVLEGRDQGLKKVPTLNIGDLVLLLDAGRSGNAKGLKRHWMVQDPDGARHNSRGHLPCASGAGSLNTTLVCWDTVLSRLQEPFLKFLRPPPTHSVC
jgi:hypothetical protein